MNGDIEVIAIHGWAFDRDFWKGWGELFPAGTTFSCYDRGYFSRPSSIEFSGKKKRRVLLVHSFGLHLCGPELLGNADLAGVFGGFRLFHPTAAKFRRRSRLVLQHMKQKLSEQPEVVLNDFWKNTYYPVDAPQPDLADHNIQLLLKDLDLLGRSELDVKTIRQAGMICIMHGSQDQIVPKSKGRELYNLLYDQASYLEIKNAGHALPMTHTEQCWSFLRTRIENLAE